LSSLDETEEKIHSIYGAMGLVGKNMDDIEVMNDAFSDVGDTLKIIGKALIVEIAPAITAIAEKFAGGAVKTAGWLSNLRTIWTQTGEMGGDFLTHAMNFEQAIKKVNTTSATVASMADDLTEAFKVDNNLFDLFSDLTTEIDDAYKAEQRIVESLTKELEPALNSLKTAQDTYNESMEVYAQGLEHGVIVQEEYNKLAEQAKEKLDAKNESLKLAASLTKEYADESEELKKKLFQIEAMKFTGQIDGGTYTRAIEDIQKKMSELNPDQNKAFEDYEKRMAKLNEDMGAISDKAYESGSASTASGVSEIMGRAGQGKTDYAKQAVDEQKKLNAIMQQFIAEMRGKMMTPVYG